MRAWLVTLGFWIATILPAMAAGSDWPQWRGPNRDGSVEAGAWPEKIGPESLARTWRVPLGPSYSGPIVAEGKVFVTQTEDKTREIVHALDRETGEELWRASWDGAMKVPFFAAKNGSWIRATPAYDAGRLYVAGMRDVLACLNAANGEEIWRVDFVERFGAPLPTFGFVSSPLIDGDYVYVQAGAAVVKLNKRDGATVWRANDDGGGMWGSAFSSPRLATFNGRRQLVVQARNDLAGLDPETGAMFWSREIPSFRGMNILTPTFFKERIFMSSYRGKTFLFEVAEKDGATALETAWENKATAYMSSPVIVGGHAYLHLQNRRVACIDLESGVEKWRSTDRFGEYWSMAVQGDRILALDEGGELILFRATPDQFEIIERREISDSATWAHLAVAGRQVFIREQGAIAAFRWK